MKRWKNQVANRACLLFFTLCLFAGELLTANAVPQGKIGIIGDSIGAGTHSSEMCRNQDIVDCVQDLGGQQSRDWSYAGGRQSWSIASVLGYLPGRVVDASDDGEEWKDAFNQAVRIMADPEVETVFIGLGANDICQARGHDYSGDLEIVASLIDETLNYLTSTLPDGGSIYWSGVPDVVQMRELMRNRDHNILFQTCQATWDLDGNDVKEGVAEDACDHYFSNNFCESAGGQGQAVDLLVELLLDTWKDIEGVNEGPCGKVLNSGSTAQDRLEARNFTMDLNRLMAQKARDWSGRNGIDVNYNDRLFYASPTIQPHNISRFDCFHPSRSGQMKFAYEIWSGFNHGNEQVKGIFIDEFDSTNYCTQEFGDWGSCWVETNDDTVATGGDIQISNNVLSMRRGSKEISRAMDLQNVDQAWISFNRRRDNLDHLGDFVNFQISADAGQTWNQLDHFVGEATDFGFHRGSYYDISQYATADTRIRLISSSQMGENDWLFFDNVKVNSWDSSAASQAAPVYGELLLDENWQAVDTPTTDSPPMVFMGVATDSAGGAGVAVVRNVGTDHFEAQLQELSETGGEISAERVSYLVLQTGTYVIPDGSHWEVGSFDIGADGTWQSQLFKTPFTDRPFLFLSLQTANNAEFPVLQVRTVDAAGFEVAAFQQVTSSSTGLNETAAYLAIYSPSSSGTVRIADTDQSYRLQRELLDGAWTPVLDTFLRRRDGVSEDDQINAETHDVMALGAYVFAQQVSNAGSDLAVPQRMYDDPTRFIDVPIGHWAFSYIETLSASGITSGCDATHYCPDDPVTRAQMAVFLERGMRGSDYDPGAGVGNIFLDVPAGYWAAGWIEQLFMDGITSGCGSSNYCPGNSTTRDEMAVFLLRAKYGPDYAPPTPVGVFNDVPTSYWAASWIEQLAAEGITSGCGGGNYCPAAPVYRDQMAVFLVNTFQLQ